ncbi:hypothetical protein [uncultured Pleomorphomonas sp.]|nr:hypothetical protein [uncultured Pleomorphomonas sp.]
MNFDLDVVDTTTRANAGVDMTITTPAGIPVKNQDGRPVSLKLVGTDSEIYRSTVRARMIQNVAEANASGLSEETIVKTEEKQLDTLVACTIGWSGVQDRDGKDVPFSAAAVRELYIQYPTIRDQADRFIGNRQNFLLKSAAA